MGILKDKNIKLLIDFDSTLVRSEGLEELANISLGDNPYKEELLNQIEHITKKGMNGEIDFEESLRIRMKMFNPKSEHVDVLIDNLKSMITKSVLRNEEFFNMNSEEIFVVSGGFKEWILPVVERLGIPSSNVFANNFIENNGILEVDFSNDLSHSKGKGKIIEKNISDADLIIVGDGFTDYKIKKEGFAEYFIVLIENVYRHDVVEKADYVAQTFDEVIAFLKNLNSTTIA